VSETARELAMSRFRLIQAHLEQNRPLQLVAADGKLPFRTAQRWVSQYRKFGLIALVRKSRDDRGGRRVVSRRLRLRYKHSPSRVLLYQSDLSADRSGSLQRLRANPCLATERSTTSFVIFQSDCLRSRIVAERHTARSLTWFIDGRRRDQTPSGRQIMRN
jgi:hypothetical protein